MTQWFLRYKPQDGYIHNWLVAGPQLIPVNEPGTGPAALSRQQLAARYWQPDSGIEDAPSEQAKFSVSGPADTLTPLSWRYLGCEDDHLVDLAGPYPPQHYLRAWAYTELIAPTAQIASLTLYSFGPTQSWLNDQPVSRQEGFGAHLPLRVTSEVSLIEGVNRLLVRLEQWVDRDVPFAIALHIRGTDPSTGSGHRQKRLKIRVPTRNQKTQLHRAVERLARRAYIERDLYAGPEALHIKWPTSLRTERQLLLRVQKPSGHIVGEVQPQVSAGLSQHILEGTWVKDGRYQVKLLPEFDEFVRGVRVSRDLDVNILHSAYVDEPQGEQPDRAVGLLQHAAWWTDGVYAEIARMALGQWKHMHEHEILRAMDQVLAPHAGCHEILIGLIFMAYRYASDASFPRSLVQRLEECLLGFDYEAEEEMGKDEQGLDDDVAIVRYACHVLSGQLYPDRLFVHSGQSGRWGQERGEQRALAWLTRRAQGGFAAWDSGEGFAAMLLGLVAIVDHAASEALSDLAAATIDKLLFSLAVNSLRGVFGSTHGATSAASITDARMEPTSPVSLLLWGVGCWNQHMAAGLALATSQKYACPPIHQMIALDRPDALWSRERHVTAWRDSAHGPVAGQEVNKVTYKTPDFMLCSAQDYRAGEAGGDEHIWQATLSPSAVVFVNHPRCMNQKDAYRPNFWRGNGVLPRVAQWRDLLIALYRLPDDDWLGYTHAHFPVAAFDEYALKRGWAFARAGDAYLALTASGGITLVKSGPGAYRELRSDARQNVWLCQMGRAAQDGGFAEFQKAILALPVAFNNLSVSLVSVRGDAVAFDWTGPFTVNGTGQPLSGFKQYESPHCTCDLGATEMDIQYAEWTLRLNLDTSEEEGES